MANSVVEIEGIQETLKLLNDIDPKFRRLVTKQIKGAGEVILSEARQMQCKKVLRLKQAYAPAKNAT